MQGNQTPGRLSPIFDSQRSRRGSSAAIRTIFLLFFLVCCIVILAVIWVRDMNPFAGSNEMKIQYFNKSMPFPTYIKYCTETCPETVPKKHTPEQLFVKECPDYFRWIHQDLQPWKRTGITREMIERAKSISDIRIVVIEGRVYVNKYQSVFQTRDSVTIWGILQLLTLYPGRLPDLDLMFECKDIPVVKKDEYKATIPPPVFHYCSNESSFDIVFPDWSFWGWHELKIKPWEILKEDLQQSNNKIKWLDREPYAYWKGNTLLGSIRKQLVQCNVSNNLDQNARIYKMKWYNERKQGFQSSNLANQCHHRYKIYVEGVAWSVSEKYILACDSVSLIVTPQYYDFFTRSLLPMIHYWPIDVKQICKSIKFAVDWGNKNPQKAQEIGKSGSRFVQEKLKMKFIYDYMFHLLSEYGKLLKYKPTIPEGAVEVCGENMICNTKGLKKKFRLHSKINEPSRSGPCTMPPPFDDKSLKAFLERKRNLIKQVETLEL